MRRTVSWVLLVGLAVSFAGVFDSSSASASSWRLTASATKSSNAMRLATTFTAASSGNFILDVEVHSQNGKVQQWFERRSFAAGESANVTKDWKPGASGVYRVKLGVFTSNWERVIAWNDKAATFTVDDQSSDLRSPSSSAKFWGVNYHALQQANQWSQSRSSDARLMERLAYTPTAQWFGDWTPDVRAEVSKKVSEANDNGATAVLVAYNIVGRDCAGHSSGGAPDEGSYKQWISNFANGINGRAYVILEPDAVAQMCGDSTARYRMLNHAVDALNTKGARVYIDAGHSNWIAPATMADRLRSAGVSKASGFAVNVANFYATSESQTYAEAVSSRLGGTNYVVDTSRNGSGSSGEWCNPSNATVGQAPTTATSSANADAYLWIKSPGDSDGYCNGGPGAGQWSSDIAMSLTRNWR